MKLYNRTDNYELYHGNMLDMLDVLESNSIGAIVTDPPYGLTSIVKRFGKGNSAPASTNNNDGSFARLSKGFMGQTWDGSGIEYNVETWKKCYDVLKPGGYLLAFGGARTFHRIACAIEDAGFEIRDTIMWVYGSGFPKSQNVGKQVEATLKYNKSNSRSLRQLEQEEGTNPHTVNQPNNGMMGEKKETVRKDYMPDNKWVGFGTCLKPAYEPIIVARKPIEGTIAKNCLKYGVGALNIDECRIPTEDVRKDGYENREDGSKGTLGWVTKKKTFTEGRFPANLILTYGEEDKEEVIGGFPNSNGAGGSMPKVKVTGYENGIGNGKNEYDNSERIPFNSGSGSAARYFYCAKASKRDRDEGLEEEGETPRKNIHPTVKPTSLMQYLVRLITPKGSTILDPFMGSGSTGKAVMYENNDRGANYKFIGIEMTDEYLPIAEARIKYAKEKNETL